MYVLSKMTTSCVKTTTDIYCMYCAKRNNIGKEENTRLRLFVNLMIVLLYRPMSNCSAQKHPLKLLSASIDSNFRHLFMSRATRQLGDKRLSPERTIHTVSKTKFRQEVLRTPTLYTLRYTSTASDTLRPVGPVPWTRPDDMPWPNPLYSMD